MPLNKLENFIKNTEGRILYVNPNDLDSTDGIENQGNSLTKPFKTIQRALLESARFSYLRGNDNDIVEKTTILVFPGEHLIDNRPGYGIRDDSGVATTISPGGATSFAGNELSLTLDSNFDLTQEDNILYKFNSVYGGIIIPRGTSIVGLDLRKTKVRPKYVPNPTDTSAPGSAIFRITGACYFWQFTFFDGDDTGLVYTDPRDFSENNQSRPTFSHHKLTCFEYADGVTIPTGYGLTDLDMYYSKISNAFNRASDREIDQKYPTYPDSFAKQRPEWEIVGAFASDPIKITGIISGDGATPSSTVTVTTQTDHGLTAGTPIKIRGINVNDYNISTKVVDVISSTRFTYSISFVRPNLPAGPAGGLTPGASASVTIETDTVSGASPYIFNVSLRSVYGMNGMHADGSKAAGFRSMVVAQFTAVSLQKDDRAFVKYNPSSRAYDGIGINKVTGTSLASGSSSTNQEFVYHLDSDAVYRNGWQSKHIMMSNDAVIQIVSVFAIGFNKHFVAESGGDASITNSNSNFGQISLASEGFKKEAFSKDDKGFITSIVGPRAIIGDDVNVEWVQVDIDKTVSVGKNNHLYLFQYENEDIEPPVISQGYRIGAKVNDKIYVDSNTNSAKILMTNGPITTVDTTAVGTDSSMKLYTNVSITTPLNKPKQTIYQLTTPHSLRNGESIRIFSETGDLPEGLEENKIYYAITSEKNADRTDSIQLNGSQIQIAASRTNSEAQTPIYITSYGGEQIRIESRVSDKKSGELGSPLQWDPNQNQWFIHTEANSPLYQYITGTLSPAGDTETEISYLLRKEDDRSLDEKLYKLRYVVPKELINGREPVSGFILQDSSSTNVRATSDFNATGITNSDYDFDRNTRFIKTCSYNSGNGLVTVRSDKPHNLKVNDKIIIKEVNSTTNTTGLDNLGYNGTFTVNSITGSNTFTYLATDIFGVTHNPGNFTNDTNIRSIDLPRFTRNDVQRNFFVYRIETITPYIYGNQDGVYYLYVLNCDNSIPVEFTDSSYSQKVTDLYPQLDRDNEEDNPPAANSFAKRFPLGEVQTNDQKRSLTRETLDKFLDTFSYGKKIVGVTTTYTTATLTLESEHGLNALREYSVLDGGSGHTDGTYYNVRLFNTSDAPASAIWDGATADIVVSGGSVISATIAEGGSGYTNGESLYFDSSEIGGTPSAHIDITTAGISTAEGNYVQVTGIGTTAGGYYRVTSVNGTNSNRHLIVGLAKTAGDPDPISNQYIVNLGRAVSITQNSYNAATGIGVFNSTYPHSLLAGNSLRILDSNNNNLGDFIVNNVNSITSFTAKTNVSLPTAAWSLKHGMSANNASADDLGENLGTRSLGFYGNDDLILGESLTTQDQFIVDLPGAGIGTMARFPLGSYIQIDNEIMRIKSDSLTGTNTNEIQVIRGSMGTIIEPHANGSVIKKIDLAPIEFRRPSILRASGHTFEYLGYGPGNYSTGLPQVQVKTLSEKEEFLSQAQETSCGTVLYTGMDSDGDFYIGNTKYSAQSGEQTTFDVPTPTITGEDPNRLSVVFDEVIVKERILVEGGNSSQILSQFDGPVTFNNTIKVNGKLILNNQLKVSGKIDFTNENDATSCTDANAALRIAGGVGIGKKLWVCGAADFGSTMQIDGQTTITDSLLINAANEVFRIRDGSTTTNQFQVDTDNGNTTIAGNTTIGGTLNVSGQTTITDSLLINAANEVFRIRDGSSSIDQFLVDTDNGSTTINGNLTVNGGSTLGNESTDNTTVSGVLYVNNRIDVDNLRIDGNTISALNTNGTINITANGSGAINLNNSPVTIDETLTVTGNCDFNGNLDVDGSTELDTTNIDGTLTTHNVIPDSNNDHNLGSSTRYYNTVYATNFTGTSFSGTSSASNTIRTAATSTDSAHYITFVDSNNSGWAQENLRTDGGLYYNPSTNRLYVANDIYAFVSDDRLKTNKISITDALNKVISLNGFTYEFSDTAIELGYTDDERKVGLSAQEVEKVLPEAVGSAAINEGKDTDYKTVQYEKLVPLLVEAIKELSAKVSTLEDKLNQINN